MGVRWKFEMLGGDVSLLAQRCEEFQVLPIADQLYSQAPIPNQLKI